MKIYNITIADTDTDKSVSGEMNSIELDEMKLRYDIDGIEQMINMINFELDKKTSL